MASELENEIGGRLQESGCTTFRSSEGSNGFGFGYESGTTQGQVWGYVFTGPDKRMSLVLLVTESKK